MEGSGVKPSVFSVVSTRHWPALGIQPLAPQVQVPVTPRGLFVLYTGFRDLTQSGVRFHHGHFTN